MSLSKHPPRISAGARTDSTWGKIKRSWQIYLMFVPVLIYYIIFHYIPMVGVVIAFEDFKPLKGVWASNWVWFKHFKKFFDSFYFWDILRNTLVLSVQSILIAFPAPIILALMLNEVGSEKFKKVVQTITYLPHFISLVVIVGVVFDFFSSTGLINDLLKGMGLGTIDFLNSSDWFRSLYIGSGLWQNIGWGTIVYLSALSNVDQQMYEAAKVDGCGRFKQILHITLPAIAPTIITLFIMNVGRIMSVGFEKALLFQTPGNLPVSELISTFVYKKGILDAQYSYSAAVGLFNNVINLIILVTANKISRKHSESSLW